ncbi:MAG: hypothetical protein H6712_24835 [Myxococcales bacterium]|nr:hypothetical protein [Myxococcales bacterium]MCB9717105.1 hypothetical protein [Myxococcales bacterium]
MDALIIGVAAPRPIRFVMDHRIYRHPALRWFFRTMGAIPIAPRQEDPEVFAPRSRASSEPCGTASCWRSSRREPSPAPARWPRSAAASSTSWPALRCQ